MSTTPSISPAEELAAFLARGPSPEEITRFRLSEATLKRVRKLMDKNDDGMLTPAEDRELDRLILIDDIIGLIQSQIPTPVVGPGGGDQYDDRGTERGPMETSGA
jgi:hypothetical protein